MNVICVDSYDGQPVMSWLEDAGHSAVGPGGGVVQKEMTDGGGFGRGQPPQRREEKIWKMRAGRLLYSQADL
jgi:hypothetical protein